MSPHMSPHDPDRHNLVLMAFPPPAVRELLHAYRLQCPFPPKRHLPAQDRLHLTVCSFGYVPLAHQPALRDIVAGIGLEPLELSLARPAALEDVTVMPARPNRLLNAYRRRLGDALKAAGFDHFGGRRPHVTLAYDAASPDVPPPMQDIPWVADEIKLVWSQLPPLFAHGRHVELACYRAQQPAQMRLFQ
jgi:2'-5' RNA ligase